MGGDTQHQRTWLPQRQRKLGQLGCHQLDERLLPMLRVEDLEVHAGDIQQLSKLIGLALHCCLVVAHEVEQSAHLPRGLLKPPACLNGAGGSKISGAFTRTKRNL